MCKKRTHLTGSPDRAAGSTRLETNDFSRGIGERGERLGGNEPAGTDDTGRKSVGIGSGALFDKTLCCFGRSFSSLEPGLKR